MRLPVYPETAPSGFQGLDTLPKEWKVIRGRFVMQVNPPAPRLRILRPEDEVSFVPMEAVGEHGGLSLDQTRALADVSGGYTEFQDDDVVVAKITPCFENGKAALARGLVNGAAYGTTELHVLRAGPTLERDYLFYVAISDRFRKLGESVMYGAGGQKRVPPEFNKDFPMPIPPVREQQQIAAFLDWKTGQIDELIARKQALLEKLKEKRIAVITQAVTRGLNPAAQLRDSGIPWLGQVPEHWEVKRLKWAVMLQRGHDLPDAERVHGNIPIVSSSGVSGCHDVAAAKAPGIVTGRYGTIGVFHLIDQDYWPLNTTLYSNDLNGNEPRFLRHMLEHLSQLFLLNSVKSAVPGVDRNDVLSIPVAIPKLEEQIAIADHVDVELINVGLFEGRVQLVIARLTEYRTALITAATTGKIDVRNVKIPESFA